MGYPPISLDYLRTMTDSTGLIQHAAHGIPNRKTGYTTDDNSRSLIVAVRQYERTGTREDLDLVIRYTSFLHYACTPARKFKDFMTYQRVFLDDDGTEDCLGRALWACGTAASAALPDNVRIVPRKMFEDCCVWVGDLTSPRARAYSMIGLAEYLKCSDRRIDAEGKIDALADSLLELLRHCTTKDWAWYETYLTYGNAILALGMLVAAQITGKKKYMDAALQSIDFLTETLIINDRLEIIGNNGWYFRGDERAWYDQQTIDAGYTVHMYAEAFKLLNDKAYSDLAKIAYGWFFGNNRSEVCVYDAETGGCCDAITPWGLNLNQGAESCVSFILAQLSMEPLND